MSSNNTILHDLFPHSFSPYFIEKDNLFDRIDAQFKKNKTNKIIIHGHPGVGKTTHAVQYAHSRFRGTVRVIYGETSSKIESGYREMARILSIGEYQTKSIDILLQEIFRELNRGNSPVLLILDNVVDAKEIEKFINLVQNKVFYIITTRNPNLSRNIETYSVNPLNKEEAKMYIDKYLDTTLSDEDKAIIIQNALINSEILPYRLEHLVVFIQNNPLFDIQTIMNKTKDKTYDNEKRLFKEIEKKSKDAWKLLKYLAFLDPDRIKPKILMELTGKSIEEIQSEILIIANSSLVKISPKERVITIHRLTQDLVRKQIKEEETKEILKILIEKINNVVPRVGRVPGGDWDKIKDYMDHAELLTLRVRETFQSTSANMPNELGDLLFKMGLYNKWLSKNYQEAIKCYDEAMQYYKILYKQEEHPDIATTLNNMGKVYQSAREYRNALDFFERSLEMKKKSFHR